MSIFFKRTLFVAMDVNYGFISNAQKFRTKFLRNYQLYLIQNGTVEPAHCKQCNKLIKGNSICCDTCNRRYHKTCSRVGKQFDTLTKSKKNWQCSSCLSNIFPFHGLDNNKIHLRKQINKIKMLMN